MRVKNSLRFKYGIITFIAFLLIGTAFYSFSSVRLRDFLISSDKQAISSHIQSHAAESFNLDRPESLKINGSYQSFVEKLSEDEGIKEVKIIDPNGIVIYSSTASEIGTNLLADGDIQAAISGEPRLTKIEEKSSTGTIYMPIKNNRGEVRGVVVAKTPVSGELKNVNLFVYQLAGIVGTISFVFIVILYFVFSNAESSVLEKDRSIVDQSKALAEEKQLDDAMINSMAESLIVINKDGQIMLFNSQSEQITGLKAIDVEYRLYTKIIKLTDKEGKTFDPNPITQSINSGKIVKLNIKDGVFVKDIKSKLTPVSVSVSPILDQNQRITGVVATLNDIQAEKELDKVKDEFVYVVAHELGNPLFALDGYLSILDSTLKKTDTNSKEAIKSAKELNQQLTNLVNDLLEAIRNESGQISFEASPIDIVSITQEVVSSLLFKAQNKKIDLSYTKSRQPMLLGNEQKIKEVVTNLVDNAIKYTPEGGKVEVWHSTDDDLVFTNVKDNGFGIDPEAQKHLFEKFYRVKTEKTQGITGTGLGLFICRQIVEKCGGKIQAKSEEGKGSTFSFGLKPYKKS